MQLSLFSCVFCCVFFFLDFLLLFLSDIPASLFARSIARWQGMWVKVINDRNAYMMTFVNHKVRHMIVVKILNTTTK